MRNLFYYFIVALLMISCKNTNENKSDDINQKYLENENFPDDLENNNGELIQNNNQNNSLNNNSPKKNDVPNTNTTQSKTQQNNTSINEGTFLKIGEDDISCACYCLEVNFNTNSELCLLNNELYINARFEKLNNGNINVYFVSEADVNTTDKKLPWEKFDTSTPIATITSTQNNEIEVDWLGFQIDGKIAIDYALYGKKTLEGKFKKK